MITGQKMEFIPYETIVVFPHSCISTIQIRTISGLFKQIIICQPFYMHSPIENAEEDLTTPIRFVYPPVSIKPPESFNLLLSEFRQWIKNNPESRYQSFYKAGHEDVNFENALWNLRGAIRNANQSASKSTNQEALKWHIVLHLAREIEENQADAKMGLKKIIRSKAPLEEALDGGRPLGKGLFNDLPVSNSDYGIEQHLLEQIIHAWMGLFIESLSTHSLFCTFDRQVFNLMRERFTHSRANIEDETTPPHFAGNGMIDLHDFEMQIINLKKFIPEKNAYDLSLLADKSILLIEDNAESGKQRT